jgi:hypothetical protein
VVRRGLERAAHGGQEGAGVEGDGGGGARGSGSSATLEPEEMMRGGAHGQCHGDGEVAAAELRDSVARAREG